MKKQIKAQASKGSAAIGAKYVQGDVILTLVEALPEGMAEFNPATKVLQESEVTGHHHHFHPTAKVALFIPEDQKKVARNTAELDKLFSTITPDEGKYIQVSEEALLFHGRDFVYEPYANGSGDHNALSIPAGIYKIDIVREYNYDYQETTRVRD